MGYLDKLNIIFTDIDGVFNTVTKNDWSPLSLQLYDELYPFKK